MKKTLLAAALIAGFAGVAQAETSVTLYGIIDAGVGYQKLDGKVNYVSPADPDQMLTYNLRGSKVGMLNGIQSGSRFGLRGTEDLGDGLRAVFNLENGFNPGNGASLQSNRLFGRRATVGLASDSWGRIDFGRQVNIASRFFESIDPFALSFAQANMGSAFSAANTVRYDNSVVYETPMFNDFQFGLGYSYNADDSNDMQTGWKTVNNTRAITTGLRYVSGPVNVALTYDQLNMSRFVTNGDSVTPKQWTLGGSYDFEVAKLALAFGQTRDGWFGVQDLNAFGSGGLPRTVNSFFPGDGLKVNSYMVGVSAPIGGASKLFASWLMADPKMDNTDAKKWQTYSLGYTYDFSKRTDLYAMGSYVKNYFFQDGVKSTLLGLGVRHRF